MAFQKSSGTVNLADGTCEIGDVNGTADSVIQLTVKVWATEFDNPRLTPVFNPANNRLTITSMDPADNSTVSWSLQEPSPT